MHVNTFEPNRWRYGMFFNQFYHQNPSCYLLIQTPYKWNKFIRQKREKIYRKRGECQAFHIIQIIKYFDYLIVGSYNIINDH